MSQWEEVQVRQHSQVRTQLGTWSKQETEGVGQRLGDREWLVPRHGRA